MAALAAVACIILPLRIWSAAGSAQQSGEHLENPFVGATFYRNVDYVASVNAAADRQGGALGEQMRKVASYPTFIWLDR